MRCPYGKVNSLHSVLLCLVSAQFAVNVIVNAIAEQILIHIGDKNTELLFFRRSRLFRALRRNPGGRTLCCFRSGFRLPGRLLFRLRRLPGRLCLSLRRLRLLSFFRRLFYCFRLCVSRLLLSGCLLHCPAHRRCVCFLYRPALRCCVCFLFRLRPLFRFCFRYDRLFRRRFGLCSGFLYALLLSGQVFLLPCHTQDLLIY